MKCAAFITIFSCAASAALGFSTKVTFSLRGPYAPSGLVLDSGSSNEPNTATPWMKSDQVRGIADSLYGNPSQIPNPLLEATRARQGNEGRGFTNPSVTGDRYANPSQIPTSLTEATRAWQGDTRDNISGGFNHPRFASGRYENPCESSRPQPTANTRTNIHFSDSRTFYTRVSDGLWDNPYGVKRSESPPQTSTIDISEQKEEIQQLSMQIDELKEAMTKERERLEALLEEKMRNEMLVQKNGLTEQREPQEQIHGLAAKQERQQELVAFANQA
jgi:hypothetical protein